MIAADVALLLGIAWIGIAGLLAERDARLARRENRRLRAELRSAHHRLSGEAAAGDALERNLLHRMRTADAAGDDGET